MVNKRLTTTKDYVRKNKLFMQNKPNFRKVKFNVTKVLTKDYEQMDTWSIRKTKPIKANKSQLKPIKRQNKPKLKKAKMNVTAALTKGYENMSNWAIYENEPKTNPIKPNFITAQRPAIAVRCRIFGLGPLFSIHERDQIYRSPRLLIDPGCLWRRGDCIKQPPALKQGSVNKEHCIACLKC